MTEQQVRDWIAAEVTADCRIKVGSVEWYNNGQERLLVFTLYPLSGRQSRRDDWPSHGSVVLSEAEIASPDVLVQLKNRWDGAIITMQELGLL